ncbi:MAG: hypothetical protein JXR10_06985 [Cyclobacteriaceae bacterium]
MDFYIHTANIFDSLGVGTIKAWFSGNRAMQDFLPGGPSTWAIFSDSVGIGNVERKYITDIIARPYPQTIAGDIEQFKYDFATRVLSINIVSNNSLGSSQIFIGANRHYPDGFTIYCGEEMILTQNPLNNKGLEAVQNSSISDFIWDETKQQLVILKWPHDRAQFLLKVVPGIRRK